MSNLHGVQELTMTVPDVDDATRFLATCFGAVTVHEAGPTSDRRGSTMRQLANADVRAVIHGSRLVRTPFLNLRVLAASSPDQNSSWPSMLDVGGWHLAAYVDDIDVGIAHVASCDAYVLGPGKKPTTNPPEVGDGSFAAHCMIESGFHFELLTYPNGRAYMQDYDGRLWNPARPDRGATLREASVPAMPGFRGFEHLSLAVADIGEATWFFEAVLGCERFYDMGPVSDPHGSGFGAYANVDARVSVSKVRVFRSPYLNFEVIEARFPGQRRDWPQLLDIGGWQIGLSVDDLDQALAAIADLPIHVLGPVRCERIDDETSRRRVSCLTAFGLYFDLLEGAAEPGAWHPARPAL
jgi:catechol 2,3-dioxygenase-like lactoylglutathione lyase family enzyme